MSQMRGEGFGMLWHALVPCDFSQVISLVDMLILQPLLDSG